MKAGVTEVRMKRKVNISMDDLLMAFDMNAAGYKQYLHLETGGMAMLSEMGDSFDENGNPVKDPGIFGDPDKYIYIPGSDSGETYRDMEAFIEAKVNSERLRSDLREELGGHRPFRRFRDVLMNHPKLDREWFDFREDRTKTRIRQWLTDNDLELKEEK